MISLLLTVSNPLWLEVLSEKILIFPLLPFQTVTITLIIIVQKLASFSIFHNFLDKETVRNFLVILLKIVSYLDTRLIYNFECDYQH